MTVLTWTTLKRAGIAVVFVASLAYIGVAATAPGTLTATAPQDAPGMPTASSSPYMTTGSDGRPVTWNVCAPIPYVTNLDHAPASAQADLNAAIAQISAATGFHFEQVGTTHATPQTSWSNTTYPGRPGWAPLVIAFVNPTATNLFGGGADQLGDGGEDYVTGPQGPVAVSGTIVISDQAHLAPGFGPTASLGTLLLHELSHAVGMAHSPNPYSYMYPYLGVVAQSITPLDAAHLATLGTEGCRTAPTR